MTVLLRARASEAKYPAQTGGGGNQKYQLFYSEDGGLMNTVNVTGKDDTIYPPEE